jgi:translation initiation factor 1
MAEICPTCGLPKDLCVCQEIVKEEQRIKVRVERRKWRKEMTVIEGINEKEVNLHELATKLKNKCACGGTAKLGRIELQGDHKEDVRRFLTQLGFPDHNIDVQ